MSAMIVEYDKKYHTLYNKFYLTAKRNNCRIYDCEGYLEFAKELYATELDNYMKNGIWSGGRKPIFFHRIMLVERPPHLIVKKGEYDLDFS